MINQYIYIYAIVTLLFTAVYIHFKWSDFVKHSNKPELLKYLENETDNAGKDAVLYYVELLILAWIFAPIIIIAFTVDTLFKHIKNLFTKRRKK